MITRAVRSVWAAPRVPNAPGPLRRDWILVGLVVIAVLVENLVRGDVLWRPVAIVLAVLIACTLPWRRIRPLTVFATAFGAVIAVQIASIVAATGISVGLSSSAYVLLLPYALFRWGSGREIVLGSPLLILVVALGYGRDYKVVGEALLELVVLALPIAIGLAVRFRTTSRARELEKVRLGEREQLARELHDTVAHHVSAMVVRAQAGQVVATTRPEAAAEALAVIEAEGKRTLAEMRTLVGALRDSDDANLAPLVRVADIVALARPAGDGPEVDVRIEGDVDGLHPSVDAALYRIAQESVTNAVRHAVRPTRVDVLVDADGDRVRVTVRDDGAPVQDRFSPSGFGLVGMKERVALLGGTLDVGPRSDGGWTVDASLPRTGARS